MVNMKKAAFLLFCLFVVMLSGCSEAQMEEFLLAMIMIVVGIVCAGGVCGAGLGFLWWAISYKKEAEKPKSLLVAILIGGIIGALGALPALYVMEAMF
jgi:nitrate/nitrite transporter NarK